jgi:ubiquinone biosynthesis protein
MERLSGSSIGDLEPDPAAASERQRLAGSLFEAEVGAMINGERFHSDPHPGNVFVLDDGKLGLIDFGAAGRLDAAERAAVANILLALKLQDPTLLREAALEVATIDDEADPAQLERAFAQLMARHLGPGAKPDAEVLREFLVIMLDFGMKPPPSITSLLRALGTLDGTLAMLSPDFNLITAAEDLAGVEMQRWTQPDSMKDLLEREAIQLAPILQRFPRHVDRIAAQIERGELSTRVSLFSNARDVRVISRLVNRAILAFIGFTLGIVSTRLLAASGGPELTGELTLLDLLGYLGLFGGAILVMRVVVEVLRDSE